MKNEKIVTTPTGEQVKIEILFSFGLEEFNKNYIAYTINDDDSYETATVLISEFDPNTNKISNIDENDKEKVFVAYQELKQNIFRE